MSFQNLRYKLYEVRNNNRNYAFFELVMHQTQAKI